MLDAAVVSMELLFPHPFAAHSIHWWSIERPLPAQSMTSQEI